MTTLQFFTTATAVKASLIKPGQIWDFTATKWTAIAADGKPLASQMIDATRMAPVGPFKSFWSVTFSLDPTDMIGAAAALVSADASGNLGDPIDLYPSPYLAQIVTGHGGWTRG